MNRHAVARCNGDDHDRNRDTAGVIAPPPLIALAAVVLGLLLDWLMPAYVLTVLLTFAAAHR